MCTEPKTFIINDREVLGSCRSCDECLGSRRNGWTAKAMAERAVRQFTMPIELTYRPNLDGTDPANSIVFHYPDIKAMLDRLNTWAFRKWKVRGAVRFIVCGEKGSKRGRVHWHCVFFSDYDLRDLGEWHAFDAARQHAKYHGKKIQGHPQYRKMVHWSAWDHGHVLVKEGSQDEVEYALKYAMKDQFATAKSEGHKRYAKSERYAASKFNMSKRPPIGRDFLIQKMARLRQKGAVLPSMQIDVPGYTGFWWPTRADRQYVLEELRAINDECRAKYGRDAPQWNTLISTLEEGSKDWEILTYDQETETYLAERAIKQLVANAENRKPLKQNWQCGSVRICKGCFNGQSPKERREFRQWYEAQKRVFGGKGGFAAFDARYQAEYREVNPFCKRRDDQAVKDAVEGPAYVQVKAG